jgi:hypothetical protein
MFDVLHKATSLCLVAALFMVELASSKASAQNSPAGRIVGHIDGLRFEKDQFHIWGWACQQGVKDSIAIHVYAGGSAYDAPKGALVLTGAANLPNEEAIAGICQDQKGRHRFGIDLPSQVLSTYRGKKLYIHGIRVTGAGENAAIARSGEMEFPDPPVFRIMPDSFPHLSGTYKSLAEHPRVFMTRQDLNDVAARINTPGTFSAQSFAGLVKRVRADLASTADWDATYSGCDADIYLHAFSFEPTGGYAGEIRSEDQLRAALNMRPGVIPPHGAAVVASRLALYAALMKAGASAPQPASSADDAIKHAKRILLAWATRGFRGENGTFFRPPGRFCDPAGHFGFSGALQISRGVIYSVDAQDLLQSLHAFSPDEEMQLNSFHSHMYDWIRTTRNQEFDMAMKGRFPDEHYSNQTANHLVAMLGAARLLDDKQRFYAALHGGDAAIPVSVPWNTLFNYVIYGVSDTPLIRITPNSSDDPTQRSAAYSTKVVAPGEINDRLRNYTALQGIGYPIFTLEHLFSVAEIVRIAGFDAYGYRGFRQQSVEMATQYYSCYAKNVGFYKTVTAEAARSCPDYQQYLGKVVNSVEDVILIGAYRFPTNASITTLETAAKAATSSSGFSTDAILFGKWRD